MQKELKLYMEMALMLHFEPSNLGRRTSIFIHVSALIQDAAYDRGGPERVHSGQVKKFTDPALAVSCAGVDDEQRSPSLMQRRPADPQGRAHESIIFSAATLSL